MKINRVVLSIWYIGLILNGIITYVIVGINMSWFILNTTTVLVGGIPLAILELKLMEKKNGA